MANKNTGKSTGKRGRVENLIPWKPGESGNPSGRPLGTRDRKTVIMDAIRRFAKAKNMTPAEVEDALQAVGIVKAVRGSFFHYEAISDGLYGKMTDKMDLTSGGKTIADLIAAAHVKTKKGGKTTTKVQG